MVIPPRAGGELNRHRLLPALVIREAEGRVGCTQNVSVAQGELAPGLRPAEAPLGLESSPPRGLLGLVSRVLGRLATLPTRGATESTNNLCVHPRECGDLYFPAYVVQ